MQYRQPLCNGLSGEVKESLKQNKYLQKTRYVLILELKYCKHIKICKIHYDLIVSKLRTLQSHGHCRVTNTLFLGDLKL